VDKAVKDSNRFELTAFYREYFFETPFAEELGTSKRYLADRLLLAERRHHHG